MIKGLITSKNFVLIALLILAGLALTSGAGPLATSTSYAATIWDGAVPPLGAIYIDSQPIELGVKFKADQAGYITGLRFYKANGDPGTHVGNLWSASGTWLASVVFTGETASGWQEMALGTPIPILANTTYVASYYSPSNYYVADANYFGSAYNNAPLHALGDGDDGPNGVFKQGVGGGFPNLSSGVKVNYWVDVVFSTTVPPDNTPPTVNSVSPVNGAVNVVATANITATFSEAMDPVTISASSFELRDSLSNLVSASVSYNVGTKTAVLNPTGPLGNSTTYTATVKGGASGVKDIPGNAMSANFTWSFTTA